MIWKDLGLIFHPAELCTHFQTFHHAGHPISHEMSHFGTCFESRTTISQCTPDSTIWKEGLIGLSNQKQIWNRWNMCTAGVHWPYVCQWLNLAKRYYQWHPSSVLQLYIRRHTVYCTDSAGIDILSFTKNPINSCFDIIIKNINSCHRIMLDVDNFTDEIFIQIGTFSAQELITVYIDCTLGFHWNTTGFELPYRRCFLPEFIQCSLPVREKKGHNGLNILTYHRLRIFLSPRRLWVVQVSSLPYFSHYIDNMCKHFHIVCRYISAGQCIYISQ